MISQWHILANAMLMLCGRSLYSITLGIMTRKKFTHLVQAQSPPSIFNQCLVEPMDAESQIQWSNFNFPDRLADGGVWVILFWPNKFTWSELGGPYGQVIYIFFFSEGNFITFHLWVKTCLSVPSVFYLTRSPPDSPMWITYYYLEVMNQPEKNT